MSSRISTCLLALAAAAAFADGAPADEIVTTRLRNFLDQAAAEGFTGSVLVARGNRVLLAEGYGTTIPGGAVRVTADSVFTTGSITKQFTAAAILKLESAGRLSVDDSISKYFPDVPADKRTITIHRLLTHTAGFPGAIGDDLERVGRNEYVRRALSTKLLFEPGSRYEYSNVGYSLLAGIVELVSGKSYETFLRETLFVPAGMPKTGYHLADWDPARIVHGRTESGGDAGTSVERALSDGGPGWHLLGNGGIHSTVGDMYRWHTALQGDSVLTQAAKIKMYTKHIDEGGGTWYGYGWSIEPTPWGEMITHNGGNPFFFSDFLRFPDSDVVIYYSTASRERRMRDLARPLARIVFTGETAPLSPSSETPIRIAIDGPLAAEGTPAKKWGFPASYRGTRAADLLEAITSDDPAFRYG